MWSHECRRLLLCQCVSRCWLCRRSPKCRRRVREATSEVLRVALTTHTPSPTRPGAPRTTTVRTVYTSPAHWHSLFHEWMFYNCTTLAFCSPDWPIIDKFSSKSNDCCLKLVLDWGSRSLRPRFHFWFWLLKFDVDLRPWNLIPRELWTWTMHVQKVKVKCQSVQKLEW